MGFGPDKPSGIKHPNYWNNLFFLPGGLKRLNPIFCLQESLHVALCLCWTLLLLLFFFILPVVCRWLRDGTKASKLSYWEQNYQTNVMVCRFLCLQAAFLHCGCSKKNKKHPGNAKRWLWRLPSICGFSLKWKEINLLSSSADSTPLCVYSEYNTWRI